MCVANRRPGLRGVFTIESRPCPRSSAWIEHWPPEPGAQVQILSGTPPISGVITYWFYLYKPRDGGYIHLVNTVVRWLSCVPSQVPLLPQPPELDQSSSTPVAIWCHDPSSRVSHSASSWTIRNARPR